MPTPLAETQRDNLNIGVYLVGRQNGAPLEDILQAALGYDPNGEYPINSFERYERRFRAAQKLGRDKYRTRTPGYFTFNAMPFGQIYLYKVLWYTWYCPERQSCSTVPMMFLDLQGMRRLRDKDLRTREATTRSIRAAHNIEEERAAIQRGDYLALQAVQSRMVEDDSLGEILSGWHGLPYADFQAIIDQLPEWQQGNVRYSFQQTASRIRSLQQRIKEEESRIAHQLSSWVILQTGIPNNAPELALQDAIARLQAGNND